MSAAPAAPERPPADLKFLRRLVWFYLLLWITEGALRKWAFPGLASPLLVLRDPFLLLIYAVALGQGVFPRSGFVLTIALVGFGSLLMSIVATSVPLLVQLYGFRSDYLHLPLIFVIPMVFDLGDVRRVGKYTLLSAVPMSALVLLQFGTASGSRFNVGAGGNEGMIESAFGHIRPSGTFSFTNGLTDFTALVAAFFLYHLLEKRVYPRLIWYAAMPSLAILVLLSGSRGAVGLVIIILLSVLFISLVQVRYLAVALRFCAICVLGSSAVASLAIFRAGLQVFKYRFGNAENVRLGFVNRFFDSVFSPLSVISRADFYGVGLGVGTNVGASLMFGRRGFLVAENELERVILESGPVFGLAFIGLRVAIVGYLFFRALGSLRRDSNPLPMLIVSATGIEMILGQYGQATTLGFVTIAGGLCLAANNAPRILLETVSKKDRRPPPPPPAPVRSTNLPGLSTTRETRVVAAPPPAKPLAAPVPPRRGRSLYAERLHTRGPDEPEPPSA